MQTAIRVGDVMTARPQCVGPESTVEEAAALMARLDVGVLPVMRGDDLVGLVTDRDIALRVVGQHRALDTEVGEVLSGDVVCVREVQTVSEAAAIMAKHHVQRLPVVDEEKRLVGIVSLGDLAQARVPQLEPSAHR